MKLFVVRDKEGKLYGSLKPFSRNTYADDWKGYGVVELEEDDIPQSCLISFEDESNTICHIAVSEVFGCTFDAVNDEADNSVVQEEDEDLDSGWFGWFKRFFS